MVSTKVTYLFCVLAIFAFGSYLLPYRTDYIRSVSLDPLIFQLYFAVGIFMIHWLAAAFLPWNDRFVDEGDTHFYFSGLGIVSGMISTIAFTFSLLAAHKIGWIRSQSYICTKAIIISYLYGLHIFHEHPKDRELSIAGIVVMVLGVQGLAYAKTLARACCHQFDESGDVIRTRAALGWSPYVYNREPKLTESDIIPPPHHSQAVGDSRNTTADEEQQHLQQSTGLLSNSVKQIQRSSDHCLGIVYTIVAGVLSGTSLVTLHYIPDHEKGFNFLPGFGVGVMILSPLIAIGNSFLTVHELPAFHWGKAMRYGIVSGIIWSVGNLFTVGAVDKLSYGVAIPIIQCLAIVSTFWGISLYQDTKRVRGAHVFFVLFASCMIAGAVMLADAHDHE